MMSTRVWHSGMLNDPWSMSLNRSGSGSSFFEYWTSACIFSSRPIERNSLNTRSIDGGMPELGGALSISSNLIMFRETDHQRNGEQDANQESDCHMGRRTQDRKGKLQGRERRDQRSIQLQLTVRERGRIEKVKFDQIAQETKEGCPVSKALKGNVELQLEARLL